MNDDFEGVIMEEKRVRLTSVNNRGMVVEATLVTDCRGAVSFKDFAFNRRSAIDRVSSFGYKWAAHLKKIADDPKSSAVPHWVSELCAFWSACVLIKMKGGNGFIPMELIRDYLLDGYNIDFKNKELFNRRMLAVGNREISVSELRAIINETILRS